MTGLPARLRKGLSVATLVLAFLAGFLLGETTARFRKDAQHDGEEPAERVPVVELRTLARSDFVVTESYIGEVRPNAEFDVGFEVAGRVAEVFFDDGERVSEGDILARLELSLERARLEEAEALHEQALIDKKRIGDLFAQGAASDRERDSADLREKQLAASVKQARLQVEKGTLSSPVRATVARRLVESGETVAPGVPAYRLVTLDWVKVVAALPGHRVARLRRGQTAKVSIRSALAGEAVDGIVSFIPVTGRAGTGLFDVEIRVENPDGLLRPGMIANATIAVETMKDVFVLGENEVVEERGSRHSYTVEHSVVKRRDLNRAVRFGDKYVVADGLEAGERLITRGQYRVSPGMKVREAPEGLPDARD